MYVLVLILSIGNVYINVQAVNAVYSTLEDCKSAAVTVRNNLMSTKPTPDSNVYAYCTQIPTEV